MRVILLFLLLNIFLFAQVNNYNTALEAYNNRNYTHSISILEAMKIKPSDIDSYLLLIDNYIGIKDFNVIDNLIKDAESYHPKDYRVLERKLKVAILRNRNSEARAIINSIRALDSKNYYATYAEGLLSEQAGYYKTAMTLYERAIIINPNRYEAVVALAYLKLANGNRTEALRLFNRNVENNPRIAESYYNLANYYYLTKDYNNALNELRNAFYYYPDYIDAKILEANIDIELNRYEDAIKVFDSLSEDKFKNDSKYYYIGNVYENAKNYNNAKLSYIRYLKSHPESEIGRLAYERVLLETNPTVDYERDRAALYYGNLASYYTRLADNIRSQAYLKHMLKLNPANTFARLMLSDVYRRMKLNAKSLEELEIAKNVNPNDKSIAYKYDSYKRKLDREIPSKAWGFDNQYNVPNAGFKVAIVDSINLQKESSLYLNTAFYQTLSYVLPQYAKFQVVDLYNNKMDNFISELNSRKIDYYLKGSAFDSYDSFTTILDLVDVRTGKVVTNFSITTKGKEKLVSSAVTVGRVLSSVIPIHGQVIKIHNDNIYINVGKLQGITNDMVFNIYDTTTPSTELLDKANIIDTIAMAKVINADENVSLIKLLDSRFLNRVSINNIVMPVYTNK